MPRVRSVLQFIPKVFGGSKVITSSPKLLGAWGNRYAGICSAYKEILFEKEPCMGLICRGPHTSGYIYISYSDNKIRRLTEILQAVINCTSLCHKFVSLNPDRQDFCALFLAHIR